MASHRSDSKSATATKRRVDEAVNNVLKGEIDMERVRIDLL